MKRILVAAALISLAAHPALAQKAKAKKQDPKAKPAVQQAAHQADPVMEYLQKPTDKGYRAARARLDSLLAAAPQDRRNLVLSFYVERTNLDAQVEQLYAERDSLDDMTAFSLANYLLEARDHDRAIALYAQLNAKKPKWSCPWRHRGEALYRQGRLDEAEAALLKAVETRQTHYDAYVWLAKVQRDLKRYADALETVKTAFKHKGRDVEDPGAEIKDDEDVKLLDELLLQNMVQPDQVEAERNKIIRAAMKPIRK
ncbi:MAG: tetratricopeptide repeat protein [Candidatus Edwardsbacteria bacterium]|jgi:tetratricopeptide (TPR) repeat protein|nr:tetratricopeptide repeat protein [Candidatus Edwardsbacteria bacterium]